MTDVSVLGDYHPPRAGCRPPTRVEPRMKQPLSETSVAALVPSPLVVRLANGAVWPLIVRPGELRTLIGDERSERAIRNDCAEGRIPTLPRAGGSGGHYRIPTARYLDMLGVPYEIAQQHGSESGPCES